MRPPSLLLPLFSWALLGMLAACLNALLRVAVAPFFIQPIFDEVLAGGNLGALPPVLALGLTIVVLGSAALWAQDTLLGKTAAITSARWREAIYARLLSRRPGSLGGSSGGLTSRLLTDLRDVENHLQFGLGMLIAEALTLLGILAVLFWMNALATLYLLLMALPLGLSLWLAGRQVARAAREAQENTEAVGAHIQEGLKQHEIARAFGLKPFLLGRLEEANRQTARAQARRALWAGLQTPLAQVLGFAAIAALLVVLTRSLAAGAMSLGEVTAYITLLALIATPAQLLPKSYAFLQGARAASARLEALYTLSVETPAEPLGAPEEKASSLALKGLGFSYPNGQGVLDKINATWQGPKLIALTGPSGSGKSTLLRLLLRFWSPETGSILLGSRLLADYPEEALRRRVAYVPQESALFRASLRDNVLVGRDFDDARLWQVLALVKLDEVVRSLPDGLDHALDEEGRGFSGGEKQRLMVARAIIAEPEVLLLDEPSAGLDEDSERVLTQTLRAQAEERLGLVVVVAHRPALIEAADEVYELLPSGALRLVREASISRAR
jgi:ATP-binding cassette, subfamily B, bacterial